MKCWGLNSSGQLGNGTSTSSLTPVLVHGSARQVSAGGSHTCSVSVVGDVRCWGLGTKGQLGNNAATSSSSPVAVTFPNGTAKVVHVTSGNQHTCALHADGAVSCWGSNGNGQVGGANTREVSPRMVSTYGRSNPAVDVVAGMWHTCALAADGRVSCWGKNDFGQTSDPSLEDHDDPRLVAGLDDVLVAPQVTEHSESHDSVEIDIAASSELGVQLDLEFSADAGFSGVTSHGAGPVGPTSQVSVGAGHACAVTVDQVRCWGDNASLQSGTGTLRSDTSRLASHDLTGIVSVAAGSTTSCAVDVVGDVVCWGRKPGTGTLLDAPEPVALGAPATAVSVGDAAACAVLADGDVKCWGSGGVAASATPTAVDLGAEVKGRDVAVGDTAACVVTGSGEVRCWGTGPVGGSGLATSPAVVTSDDGTPIRARFVDVGSGHACAVTDGGDVTCWGSNSEGQLGRNSTLDSATAGVVSQGTDTTKWLSLGVGGDMTCGLRASAAVQCWGSGTGTAVPTDVAVASSVGAVSALAAGAAQACALTVTGDVACWDGGATLGGLMPSSKMVSATIAITDLSPTTDYVARGVVTRAGRWTRSAELFLRTTAETTTTSSTTTSTTTSTSTTTTTTTVATSTSTSTTTTSTSTTTVAEVDSDETTSTSTSTTTTVEPVFTEPSVTTTTTDPDEIVWPTTAASPETTAPDPTPPSAPESVSVEQQSNPGLPRREASSSKRPRMVTLAVRQGERLTMRDLARRARVRIPESMVVRTLTSSRVESVAAWSETTARLVVSTVSRCQATLADFVHPAVRANRPGKCLVVLTVRRPNGETVARNVTLEVRGTTTLPPRARVGKVR